MLIMDYHGGITILMITNDRLLGYRAIGQSGLRPQDCQAVSCEAVSAINDLDPLYRLTAASRPLHSAFATPIKAIILRASSLQSRWQD